ncbi:conserved Plasmodium protein, unknown function [Plasmodium malariae]|uniref:Uncharacterized protein n=1 Tax=Plasmodium malariae TaxID=5858 RepID=A0A1C3KA36_PLAMA|nr:conserved Plasmodium protein, unknown function [Plasmodium malariae]
MNEKNIKEKLNVSINHLNKRKLKFEIKIFPIEKTVYEIFNIFSKRMKKKLKLTLIKLKRKKKKCDKCSEQIDTFNPFLTYDIDVYCSKCYTIKNFSAFSNELYKNVNSDDFLNFSPLYQHYYNVNNLEIQNKNILENDINTHFTISVLAKNLRWSCCTPHNTYDEFLEFTLNSQESKERSIMNEDIPRKRKVKEALLTRITNDKKKKKRMIK